jgi:hypothetical protein
VKTRFQSFPFITRNSLVPLQHGVPRPTVNGEVWVFNKSYTQYIPVGLYKLNPVDP